jgi:hypothetical protein
MVRLIRPAGSLVMPSFGGVEGLGYYGRVSARNSEGYSLPMQAPEPMAPKVVPAAPTGVSLSVSSATSLRLMFGSPSDNGGDNITGYLVEWSTSSAFTNVQSIEVSNLSRGSPFFADITSQLQQMQSQFFRFLVEFPCCKRPRAHKSRVESRSNS